jgi:hypothetical protein
MRYHQRERLKDRIWGGAILGILILLIFGMYPFFNWVDCKTATNNLAYVEACEKDARCQITEHERASIVGWSRLQHKRCKKS